MCSYRTALRLCRSVLHSFTFGFASLPECFAFVHVWPCVSAGVFCVRSRLLFDARAKQDGLRKDTFLFRRGSRSPLARSRVAVRLSDLDGSFRDCAFSGGDPDGETKGRRERSRRRGRVRFCVIILALQRFPRGVRWGKMWKPHCGWPGKSCGRAIAPMRANL